MSLDGSTEVIAHFIGTFHLETEAQRLRADYEAFRAARLADPDKAPPAPPPVLLSAPYDLRLFDPGLSHVPLPPAVPALEAPLSPALPAAPALADLRPPAPPREAQIDPRGLPEAPAGAMLALAPPPANSIAVAVVQKAVLFDDDLLDFGAPNDFLPLAGQRAALEALAGAAAALDPGLVATLGDGPTLAGAEALAARMAGAGEALAAPGVTGTVLKGEAAQGRFVDGEAVEALPSFLGLLPPLLKPKEEDPEAPDPRLSPPSPPQGPFGVDPGHAVVSGANLALNEALVTLRWVDAPVIAVAGSVMELNAISQTNVMVSTPWGEPSGTALNAAAIGQTASGPAPGLAGGPTGWHVVTIEGDLMLVTHIRQQLFLSDMDRAEVVVTAAATYIGLGENMLANLTSLTALGYRYDAILVEGDMLTLNAISQVNVLLDMDRIEGVMGSLSAQGNLQLNKAEIAKVGIDSLGTATGAVREGLETLGQDTSALLAALAGEAALAGRETLIALHVKGDLVKMTLVEQVNVVGDSDQIQLLAGGVDLTTGSNAQLNAVRLVDDGLDSQVLALGGTYSDALIHQAGLIDLTAPPAGALPAVVNEAIAFLAEGMIEAAPPPVAGLPPGLPDHPGSLDVMQTALA